ncbi:hypothetical protein ES703_59925 [subsurface metagenome]
MLFEVTMKDDRTIANNFFRALKKEETEKIETEKKIKVEAEKVEAVRVKETDLEVFTTKPMPSDPVETRGRKPLARIVCPFCEEERKQKGITNHISHCHGVPGFTVKDVFDVQDGVKPLENLVYEKFDDDAEIDLRSLSPRVSKEVFGSWEDVEAEADPVDQKIETDPIDLKVEADNPGRKVEADNPGRKVERRKFNWIPFFSPFNRRRFKK